MYAAALCSEIYVSERLRESPNIIQRCLNGSRFLPIQEFAVLHCQFSCTIATSQGEYGIP